MHYIITLNKFGKLSGFELSHYVFSVLQRITNCPEVEGELSLINYKAFSTENTQLSGDLFLYLVFKTRVVLTNADKSLHHVSLYKIR